MKIMRTQNATNNLKWGIINKVVSLLIPFICRTAVIQIFGINYLGLNSLFSSILSVLNFAELGFGSAVVFFLYRAIAEDDTNRICALLNYIKRVYNIVGTVVLLLGLSLLPFLENLIKSDVPAEVDIYVLYLLTLASTVLSYFLFAYKNAVFLACQRVDIVSKISTIVMAAEKLLQLVFIFVFRNYYLYIGAAILAGIMNNLLIFFVSKKQYPQYMARGDLDRDEKKQIVNKIRGLFAYKLGNVVNITADSIVISAFLGLTIMGQYGNYYYVLNMLMAFLGVYYSSFRAGIGNSMIVESVEKNYGDFRVLQVMQNWIIAWCTICLFCLFQDFIAIYVGEQHQLAFGYVVCFCIYFWIWKVQDVVYVFKEAAGLWTQDSLRPLIGAALNLVINLILVQFIGLYGVILSTVCVFLFLDIPWASAVLFKQYFGFKPGGYYKLLLGGFIQMLIMLIPTCFLCTIVTVDSLLIQLMIKAVICVVVPNLLFVAMNYRKQEFKSIVNRVFKILKINLKKR